MMKPRFVACLGLVCIMLLPLSARASNESVTLITGETIEARFIDHYWRNGQECFVFATPSGATLEFERGRIALISFRPYPPRSAAPPLADVIVETEPNNGLSSANPIAIDMIARGAITPAGDVDIYRVSLPGPGAIHVACTQPDDLEIQLLDSGKKVLRKSGLTFADEPLEFSHDVVKAGDYYIKVAGFHSFVEFKEEYRLKVGFTQAGNDPFEPNDTPGQAAAAPLGRGFDAYISRPGDLDYYMLSVWGPSTISVESTQPRDYYLAVLAPDGKTRLAGGDLGFAGERMSVSCDVHQPGTYYVLMKGFSDSEHSMHEPYTMMISVEPRPVR